MRILFIAFPSSLHTARWINQITDQGWELHLMPSVLQPLHPRLRGKIKVHSNMNRFERDFRQLLINLLALWPHPRGSRHVGRLIARLRVGASVELAANTIEKIKPDIVHSMEIQRGGYLALSARDALGDAFPTWLMSNWGSDIHLFHRLAEHQERIQRALEHCDYYTCECQRDVDLATQLGLRGKALPVIPCAGGFDLAYWHRLRQPGPTSGRRVILLKGNQHWAGRVRAGLCAIEMCADVILEHEYSVLIHLASPEIPLAAELVTHATGIPITIVPFTNYEETMRRFSLARIHIGLSISDGISQSLLESMVMGAFPIQSNTACANEWVEDGKNGLLVPPEDPHIIAEALRRAIIDDDLVDQAVAMNDEIVRQRLSYAHIQSQTIEMYESIFSSQSHDNSLQTSNLQTS